MDKWKVKFTEDEYKKNLDIGVELYKKGEISRNDFLNNFVNRHTAYKNMLFKDYEKLPDYNYDEVSNTSKLLEKNKLPNVRGTIGPFRFTKTLPSHIDENGTGFGAVLVGYFNGDSSTVRLQVDRVNVIFDEEQIALQKMLDKK